MRPFIETSRLLLREFVIEDAPFIFNNWAKDPEVSKYLTWLPHKSVEETKWLLQSWIKEYENPKTVRFGIVLKENNELIGAIDVVGFINEKPVIGYCLSRKHWNNGYMSEACEAFIKYLFELGYQEILIEANERNIASNRVIQKCKFKFNHKETRPCSRFKPEIITVNCYTKKVA